MTTTTAEAPVQDQGLLARAFGVIFSPRATYAAIVAHPKVLGALLTVTVIIAATTYALQSTEFGQQATLDQQLSFMRSIGREPTDQMITALEQGVSRGKYFAAAAVMCFVPLVMALEAVIFLVIFNAILGGEARFKQLYAVVAHSGFIGVVQQLFVTPLNMARQSMTSATSLNIFFPMLPDTSFISHLAGNIDLFRIWSLISLSIGLGVLYKRKTAPIAWALFTVYGIFALAYAGFQVMRSGV
jgi:hypothetical protein